MSMIGDADALRAHLQLSNSSATLAKADTVFEDSSSDINHKEELLKIQMQLTWAETRIVNLKKDLETEKRRASEADKRAVEAEERAADTATLQDQVGELHGQLQNAQALNEKLEIDIGSLRTVSARNAKIERVAGKYEMLFGKQSSALENARNAEADLRARLGRIIHLEAQHEDFDFEKRELQMELANARHENDRLRSEHALMLSQHNHIPSERRLGAPNTKFKAVTDESNAELNILRINTAQQISEHDLAKSSVRLFVCEHTYYRNIPDGQKSTRKMPAAGRVEDLFSKWKHDEAFLEEYTNVRRAMIAHHRAHERQKEGRGIKSCYMWQRFVDADEKRRVVIRY